MAGTIICDYIRSDANQLSLNVGNTTFATINASGFFSNTGTQLIAANGTVATSALSGTIATSQVADSAITRAKLGIPGAVLQVVTATYATTVSTASGSQIDTGLSATITPTSATSKILVLTSCRIFAQPSTPATIILLRNATNIQQRYRYGLTDTSAGSGDQFSTAYLDSPATTSATTYKVTFSRQSGSGTIYAQLDNDMSTMTLMEIAG
jgi:hypothetical protein